MHKTVFYQKLISVALSAAMMIGLLPLSAAAETDTAEAISGGEITSFAELDADTTVQSVPLGTSETELNLPNTLAATVRNTSAGDKADTTEATETSDKTGQDSGAEETDIAVPVTWTASPDYNGDTASVYSFTPALPEDFTLADGVGLPVIAVTVVESAEKSCEITAFGELADGVRWQRSASPTLPDMVRATVDGEDAEVPVTWQADHSYDADNPESGLYVFTAQPGKEYTVAKGVETPRITVYIPASSEKRMLRSAANSSVNLKIENADQLAELAALVNAGRLESFIIGSDTGTVGIALSNDIDLSAYGKNYNDDKGWTPIGIDGAPFKSNFDGGGHTITGLYINRKDENYIGLFGDIEDGTVQNISLADVSITGYIDVGGVAGYCNGILQNCDITGTVGGKNYVGGVAGSYYYSGIMQSCHVACTVSGTSYVGGVAGYVNSVTDRQYSVVQNCYSAGSVSGFSFVGGVTGRLDYGRIQSCYSTGTISGTNYIGGIAAYIGTNSTIQNCYSTGAVIGEVIVLHDKVQGAYNVGGIAGQIGLGTVQNCYSTGVISGTSYVGGVAGRINSGVIQGCAALNQSVSGVSGVPGIPRKLYVERVTGALGYSMTLSSNAAFSGMTAGSSAFSNDADLDGTDKTSDEISAAGFFQGMFGNDNSVWNYTDGGLPTLADTGGTQNSELPPYILNGSDSGFQGEGTENDPYQINTAQQLARLAVLVNAGDTNYNGKYYRLTADIDLSAYGASNTGFNGGSGWPPIGNDSNNFLGIFDGDGHVLTGLYISRSEDCTGLFGCVSGTVKSLGLKNVDIEGGSDTGGVAGKLSGVVQNCYVTGSVGGGQAVGGLAGTVDSGTMQDCYATCAVSGNLYVGGMAGDVSSGTLRNCYATGSVCGNDSVGGLAGIAVGRSTVQNCAALNPGVKGSANVGRTAGNTSGDEYTSSGNVAFSKMNNGGAAFTGNVKRDGTGKSAAEIAEADFFKNLFGGDNSAWVYADGKLPVLAGMSGAQDADLPYHISGRYFGGGDGSNEENAYEISTSAQLVQLAELVNAGDTSYNGKYYRLTANIDLSAYGASNTGFNGGGGWLPIGNDGNTFLGTFDGDDHVVTGLYISRSEDCTGLFGCVNGTVKRLGLKNVNIKGGSNTGGIAGKLSGTVQNCCVTGSVGGGQDVGGVAGNVTSGIIQGSHVTCAVSGESAIGGIAGATAASSAVQSCYATGTVSGDHDLGGVAGNVASSIVQNCYATGTVSGAHDLGGVVGNVAGGTVQNCYATGAISGNHNLGGVAGIAVGGSTVRNCAALNSSVSGSSCTDRVVWFSTTDSLPLYNNYAFSDMKNSDGTTVWTGDGAADGANLTIQTAVSGVGFWQDILGWDGDSVWTIADGELPTLKNLAGQSGDGGIYLTKRDIQHADVTVNGIYTYTGSAIEPDLTVTFDSAALIEDMDYSLSFSNNTNAGTATVSIQGIGNYTGIKEINYTIEKAALTVDAEKSTISPKTYDGTTKAGILSVAFFGVQNGETLVLGKDYTTTGAAYNSADVASASTVTVTVALVGNGPISKNYAIENGTFSKAAAIEKRPVTVRADDREMTCGETLPAFTYTVDGQLLNETALAGTPAVSCTTDGKTVGSYSILVNMSGVGYTGNYKAAEPSFSDGTLTVYSPSSGSSSSGGAGITTASEGQPDQPVTPSIEVTATAGVNHAASAAIPDDAITEAIAKARADADAHGKNANGISVALNITTPLGTVTLSVALSHNSLKALVNAGVSSLTINGASVDVSFDLVALMSIQSQSSGNMTVTIASITELPDAAKAIIGARAVYNITVSSVKDGKALSISSLGSGQTTFSIPYVPENDEAVDYLYGVYIDKNGNPIRIDNSVYDPNSGCIIFTTGHFSVYGVGYTSPSAQFIDIEKHWAKASIDYVVGRGLLGGTTDTTFSPDTAMSRGMLIAVLGRLSGVDMSGYKTSNFTDVAAGSYYHAYIEWAYKNSIIQGVGNCQFAPDRAVTREEIAVILQNYAKATGYKIPVTRDAAAFTDSNSIDSAYRDAVKNLQQAGILIGDNNNEFSPKAVLTRAEVSAMLYRYIKLTIDPATAQGWVKNDSGQRMYYKDGKALTGWQRIDGKIYCFDSSGCAYFSMWKQNSKSEWFYLSSNGYALIGWWDSGANGGNKRYYFGADAVMTAGKWLKIESKWYYFYKNGSLAVSTTIDGCRVDDNGVKQE